MQGLHPHPLKATILKIQSTLNTLLEMVDQGPEPWPIPGSQWTVVDHLEHLSLTGKSTPLLIDQALETNEGPELNGKGVRLFELGRFPRGKTQSPEFAHPKGIELRKMKKNFQRLARRMEEYLGQADRLTQHPGRSAHPALGGLTPAQWFTFLDMHLRHHLEIIGEAQPKTSEE